MGVNAIELRPRNAMALFDAAIRVCASSSGVWALTLPAGAALIAALFNLVEAIRRHQSLALPAALWTLAWAARAISQGAACAYLEQQILSKTEPTVRGALRLALTRAPGLITASMTMALLNGTIMIFTVGLGFLFLGAHAAGFAAVMRGEGSALNVYGTSAKLLGPARSTATWVRVAGLVQLPLAINLHLAVGAVLYLMRSVLGFDVTFFERFASLDNGTWVATVAVTTFAIFEPLRAAAGTLLLIDGRVRQEGLDLLAAAQQLPHRRKKTGLPGAAAALLLALGWPTVAQADSSLTQRLDHLRSTCHMQTVSAEDVRQTTSVTHRDQAAFSRFVARLESAAFDDEDCEAAEAGLREGLAIMPRTPTEHQADDPQALAKTILNRPEFQQLPPAVEGEQVPDDQAPGTFSKWWADFWRAFFEWLKKLLDKQANDRALPSNVDLPSPMLGANVVMVVVVGVVLATLLYVLLKGRSTTPVDGQLDHTDTAESPLSLDPQSALSRPAESWAGLADDLAGRGEFREAIRHLYLALLARLHRDGAIDYDPTFSNWEYLRSFKGAREHHEAFRNLTRRFDFAWYGNQDLDGQVSARAWQHFRTIAEPLLVPAPPEARGA